MVIRDLILQDTEGFRQLCIKHGVSSLHVFGSSVGPNFDHTKSDIDVLVEVDENDPLERGEKLIGLWDSLEQYFKRKVDLLTESSLKNPYLRKRIEATKELIYDGRSAQVFV